MRIMRAVRIMAHVRAVRVVAGKQCAASITVKPEHIGRNLALKDLELINFADTETITSRRGRLG